MEVKAEVKFLQGDKFDINIPFSNLDLYIDKRKEDHSPSGPNPLELFISALGGCIGVYAKSYLTRHQIEFSELKVNVDAELSKDSPIRLVNIKVKVSTDADLGQNREVFLRFIKNCPIHNTILYAETPSIDLEDL
jgi:uncharacterized OsmC-like protein